MIRDEVTTTDELIPSGETASYRSNPYKISEFTLIRKDPHYVGNAKAIQEYETARRNGDAKKTAEVYEVLKAAGVTGTDRCCTSVLVLNLICRADIISCA